MRKKTKNTNVSKVTIILSLSIMGIIFIYTIINSNYFYSKNINISGNKNISNEEIIDFLNIKKDKNIFMYSISSMEEKLLSNNYIKDVKIERKIPDTINIKLQERDIFAILSNGKFNYLVDEEGEIIEKIDEIKKDSHNILVIQADYDIIEDKLVYENLENDKNIPYLIKCIKNENLAKQIKTIKLDTNQINMITKDDLEIILTNNNIGYNLSMISAVLVDIQSDNKKGGYLDLTNGYALYKP